jgi:hypothetical protein
MATQTFSLNDNQHGTLQADAVDAGGNPSSVTVESATSDNPAVLAVQPNVGFPNQFGVIAQGKVGLANVTVTGKNSAGVSVSTVFGFSVLATPAVGFSGQLINVANN